MIQCFSHIAPSLSGGGTRFNSPASGNLGWDAAAGGTSHRWPISAPGTFRNWRAQNMTALGSGNTRDYTIYKNNSATALTVTAGNDTSIHDDVVNSFTVAAGDYLTVGSTAGGTPVATLIKMALEFEGDNANESIYGGPGSTLGTGTVFHNLAANLSTNGVALAIDDSQTCWPIAGSMTRLDIRLNTAPGGVTVRTFTIYKNGVAQDGAGGTPNTVITITGAATTGSSTFSMTAAEGDLLSLHMVVTGSPAGSVWGWGCAFTATTDGQFAICVSDQDSVGNVAVNFSSVNPLNWEATESNATLLGNITTFNVTGFRLALNAADNGRVFQPRVSGADAGPSLTLAGGATTGAGSGSPVAITSADTYSFKTTPGTQSRTVIWGWNANAQEALRPGPLVDPPYLRFARINGGMLS